MKESIEMLEAKDYDSNPVKALKQSNQKVTLLPYWSPICMVIVLLP